MSEMTMEQGHAPDTHSSIPSQEQINNSKFAMWLYLASEVIIFTVFIAAYVVFRINNPDVVKAVHEELGVILVSINTFILLTSSWALVMGLREAQKNNSQGAARWLGVTVVLGTVFVLLQYVEYNELARIGVSLDTEFGMRFYAPTAFHGAHVIVGVLWGLWVMNKARKGRYGAQNYLAIEIFGLYWHFVDVVWVVLFTVIYLI